MSAAAAAVRDLDGVAGLAAGQFGDVSTHLPGTRIRGVRVDGDAGAGGDAAQVHVILYDDVDLLAVAEQVRGAAAEQLGLAPPQVVVTIADLAHRRPPPAAQTQERS